MKKKSKKTKLKKEEKLNEIKEELIQNNEIIKKYVNEVKDQK